MAIVVVNRALVDDIPWVTVKVSRNVAQYLFRLKKYYFHRHVGVYMFDIPESVLSLLRVIDNG